MAETDKVREFIRKEFTRPVRLKSKVTGKFLDEPKVTPAFERVEVPSPFEQRLLRLKPIVGRIEQVIREEQKRIKKQRGKRKAASL
jgi:hypothetical protein